MFFSRRHAAQAAAVQTKSEADSIKSVLHLESFVVNLADPDQTAFLRIGIDLGVGQTGSGGNSADKNSPVLPKIRDSILSVLTTWQSVGLLAPEGKMKLKGQLLSVLHEQVPEVPVKEVYFTEFLVQR
ncbi:MAG TPA: flagellar basal body-associated FliL family protein [Terriglobia bacterium]